MKALVHLGPETKALVHRLSIAGFVLVALGVAGLHLGHFSFHNWVAAVDAGSIHLDAHMDRRVSIPSVSGVLVLLAGLGFITLRWRRA